jgi:hypothetical protein
VSSLAGEKVRKTGSEEEWKSGKKHRMMNNEEKKEGLVLREKRFERYSKKFFKDVFIHPSVRDISC